MTVALIVFVWLLVAFFGFALCRAAGRRTPVPPSRPRARLVRSRERAGVVEILPGFGDAENASTRVRSER